MAIEILYPASPIGVPSDLTDPSREYRIKAWLAVGGLISFFGAYVGLSVWFVWSSYRLLSATGNGADAVTMFYGIGVAFLAVFMLKAIFFLRKGGPGDRVEVSESQHPHLFGFINSLADEIRAPRPKRVYLLPQVNACVFYDLTLLNFVLPSRKHLGIGLGLVNCLNIGEFKAVLGHEFGHFAQRTMAVGRWVYVSQQIAAQIVNKRDVLDRFLDGLSRWDLRIAWVGWLFRLIIWAIRSIAEVLSFGVALAERALAREMEFQADLVSVSVSGSEALVNALHKLGAADDAWARAVSFSMAEKSAGRYTGDIFRVQEWIIERMRRLLNDPEYGRVPPPPAGDRAGFRVFKQLIAVRPQMWATHPANSDREENAKRRFIEAGIDERSAWVLFNDADAVREAMTNRILDATNAKAQPIEESLQRLDRQYQAICLDPAYRGAYFGRSTVRHARTIEALYGPEPGNALTALEGLYPASLSALSENRRSLGEEVQLLRGVRKGALTTSGDSIRYRGQEVSRQEIPRLLDTAERQLKAAETRIREHDCECRSVHAALAQRVGEGWPEYLRGLLAVHHYATHAEALLRDGNAFYQATLRQQFARGAGSKPDLDIVLQAARTVYAPLAQIHEHAGKVTLDPLLLQRMSISSWAEFVQPLKLPVPTREQLSNWARASDNWIASCLSNLAGLRFSSLEQLLDTERRIASAAVKGESMGLAAAASATPTAYAVAPLDDGSARGVRRSWLERIFSVGGPARFTARIALATAIVGGLIWRTQSIGHASVTLLNALGRPVNVRIGKSEVVIPPFGHQRLEIEDVESIHVHSATLDGRVIDDFEAKTSGYGAHDIYNVAAAGVLVHWTATYGDELKQEPPRPLGAPRWMKAVDVDVEFEDPPWSIGGVGRRSVLMGLGAEAPEKVLGPIQADHRELVRIVRTHATWDEPTSRYASRWVELARRIGTDEADSSR